jgi:hypothetical protein
VLNTKSVPSEKVVHVYGYIFNFLYLVTFLNRQTNLLKSMFSVLSVK